MNHPNPFLREVISSISALVLKGFGLSCVFSFSTYLSPIIALTDAKFPAHLHGANYVPILIFKTSSPGSGNRQDCIGESCCSVDTTLWRKCHWLKPIEEFKSDY